MALSATPKTTFARNYNPFTGQPIAMPPKTDRKQANLVDVSKLQIANDPLPSHRSVPDHKYDAFFSQLTPGNCIVCEAGDAGKIGHALNGYLKRKGSKYKVKTAQKYTDGKGRVWLLDGSK